MKSGGEKKQQKTYFCFCFEENDSDLIHADDARRARLSDRTTRVSTASMATASLQTRSLVTVCLRGSGWQGKRRVVTGSRVKTLNLVRASASSSSGETENRAPLETRLALALQEDTALTKNQNPIPPPPLPDLKDLALMASLEISDAEAEKWTPQVHGVLRWMSKVRPDGAFPNPNTVYGPSLSALLVMYVAVASALVVRFTRALW